MPYQLTHETFYLSRLKVPKRHSQEQLSQLKYESKAKFPFNHSIGSPPNTAGVSQ